MLNCSRINYPDVNILVRIDAPPKVTALFFPDLPQEWSNMDFDAKAELMATTVMDDRFWQGLIGIVVDTNIAGLDFSSPGALRESSDQVLPPWFWDKFVYLIYFEQRKKFFLPPENQASGSAQAV